MVAGATGIDLFLLVIDAAEGARPQTHEHLAILRLLGIDARRRRGHEGGRGRRGDARARARGGARARARAPRSVAVSAKTGAGLDELRAALARAADARRRTRTATGRDPPLVDRVFTLRGIGTVVTGTLWSGSIGEGDALRVEPRGLDVRVRSVQVHDRPVERAEAGQRVAVALPGGRAAGARARRRARRARRLRGHATGSTSRSRSSRRSRPTVTVHLGTADVAGARRPARALRAAAARASRSSLRAATGSILRAATTVGGGTVLDPRPPRRFDAGAPGAARARRPRRDDPRARPGRGAAPPRRARGCRAGRRLGTSRPPGSRSCAPSSTSAWRRPTRSTPASTRPPSRGRRRSCRCSASSGGARRLYAPGAPRPRSGAREEAAAALEAELDAAGLEPVRVDDRELAIFLEREGRLVRLGDGFAVGAPAYERAQRRRRRRDARRPARSRSPAPATCSASAAAPRSSCSSASTRDGVTRRLGDRRVLRRAADPSLYAGA